MQLRLWALVGAFSALAAVRQAPTLERPQALVELAARRSQILTGEVRFSWWRVSTERTVYHTSRFTASEEALFYHGDKEGVVFRTEDGKPALAHPSDPHRTLVTATDAWQHTAGSLGARVSALANGQPGVWRLRSLGLSSRFGMKDVHAELFLDTSQQPSPRRYFVHERGDEIVVEAETDHGTIRWTLNREQDLNPTNVQYIANGKLLGESRTLNARFGDFWFPARVEFWARQDHGEMTLAEVVEVQNAEFNRPDDPQVLTPNHIGVEIGTNILRKLPTGEAELVYWDGQRIISREEYDERTKTGELMRGPAPLDNSETRAREWNVSVFVLRPERYLSDWEIFTRCFIDYYQLNESQQQQAWAICAECSQRARAYFSSISDKIDAWNQQSDELRKNPKRDPEAVRRLEREKQDLWLPIDRILAYELRPRLERLPTRAQRRTAERESPGDNPNRLPDSQLSRP